MELSGVLRFPELTIKHGACLTLPAWGKHESDCVPGLPVPITTIAVTEVHLIPD